MGKHKKAVLVVAGVAVALAAMMAIAGAVAAAPGSPTAAGAAPGAVADEGFGWAVQLRGTLNEDYTYKAFRALAAAHPLTWVDDNKTPDDPSDDVTYTGVALWRLVARVDDANPGSFNATLAAKDYSIQVIGLDGFTATFTSSSVANNSDMIVADLANGVPPAMGAVKAGTPPSWRPAWPLKLCSANLLGNQKPAGIADRRLQGRGSRRRSCRPRRRPLDLAARGPRTIEDKTGQAGPRAGHQVPGRLDRQQQDARRPQRRLTSTPACRSGACSRASTTRTRPSSTATSPAWTTA